jgi:chromosomal replication initiator protein
MQPKQLWQTVLGDMQVRLSKTIYESWLKPTALIDIQDDVATVAAPNTFTATTLQARYANEIGRVMSEILDRPIQVVFMVQREDQHQSVSPAPDSPPRLSPLPPEATKPGPLRPPTRRSRSSMGSPERRANESEQSLAATRQLELSPAAAVAHGLNPRYVYETYVVGSSNRFAHAASLAVAENPGGQYNPFFIHGGVGLGKTHLLHAIGHRALELKPDLTVVYISSETFTNNLINAIRSQQMDDFRGRYRTIDILMIDDIQFIGGKDSTQEEFFHTFNALYQSGKQVVLSSDRPPKAIAGLEDRLRSRFEGGLIADVQPPDFEMRTAILRTKAEDLGIQMPNDVVEYVAHRDQTNTRELEGALNKVIAVARLTGQPVTLQLAIEALTDTSLSDRRASLTAESVITAVAAHYGVTLEAMRGRSRSKEIVGPRQMAMYLVREETGASLTEIGEQLGGRDHTTVMHGIEKIERLLQTDTGQRSHLMAIREALLSS